MTTYTPNVLEPTDDCVRAYLQLRGTLPVPAWWIPAQERMGAWRHRSNGLVVLDSVNRERDEMLWLHVSVSRASRLPSWDDLKLVREDFIGDDRECYSVFPPASRWVNTHPFALHLWCCIDWPSGILPDFRHVGQI